MTEKSVLERLRDDLAKVCDQLTEHFEYAAEDTAAHVLARRYALAESDGSDECAAAIRAHDLSSYESATPALSTESGEAEVSGIGSSVAHGAADPDVAGLIERLNGLLEKATPRPWAWDQRGEKVNEWGLGTAFDINMQPIAGRFTSEDVQYDEYVCSHEASTCNYKDPELICTLRNSASNLIAALQRQAEELAEAKEIIRRLLSEWPWPELDRAKAQKFLDAALSEGRS